MESTGRADAVQLSSAAFGACALPEDVMPTRLLDIKGKGHMRVHTVRAGSEEEAVVRAALAAAPRASLHGGGAARQRWRRLAVAVRAMGHLRAAAAASAAARTVADDALLPLPQFGDVAAAAREPSGGSSVSGGSSGGVRGGAATRDAAADALLRSLTQQHMAMAQLSSWLPPTCFLLYNVLHAHWFLSDQVPGAAAVMAVYCPFYLAGCAAFASLHLAFAARAWLPRRLGALPWGAAFAWMQCGLMLHTSVGHFVEIVLRPGGGNCPAAHPPACMRAAFWAIHIPMLPLLWLETQLPLRLIVFPECVRQALYIALALFAAHATDGLTPAFAAAVLAEAAAAALLVPVILGLCTEPTQALSDLLAGVDTCPSPLRPPRDALVAASLALRRRLFGGATLVDEHGSAILAVNGAVLVIQLATSGSNLSLLEVARRMGSLMGIILAASASTKLRPTASAPSLDALAARLGVAAEARILRELRDALAAARSEAAMLRAAGDALGALYPGAAAWAVGAFAEGTGCDIVAALEAGPDDAARSMMLAALPPDVGAQPGASVAAACLVTGGVRVLDSRDAARGGGTHSDWAAAAAAGVPTAQAVTAPLTAGPRVVGFVTLHFGLYSSTARAHNWAPLTEFLDAVGGALFVARAFAIDRDPGGGAPVAPPRLRAAPRAAAAAAAAPGAAAAAPEEARYPATAADADALAALDASADADATLLRDWGTDAWGLSDEEVQRLLLATLHSLGLLRAFRLAPAAAAGFIAAVAAHMNDCPFHCLRHVCMVTTRCALLLTQSGLRARVLTDLDCLALLLAALTHDLEHSGTTNSFHVATRSPLALRYHDTSVMENHHACVALTLLERSGLLAQLAPGERSELRKTLVAAVLATDMAVHGELLARVAARVAAHRDAAAAAAAAGADGAGADGAGAPPDAARTRRSSTAGAAHAAGAGAAGFRRESVDDRRLLVCYLLHCADLCNPLLPFPLSRRIANTLETEFAAQAALERAQELPVSVMLAQTDVAKARNEVGFIKAVVKPLYTTLADVAPPLRACLARMDATCAQWEALIAAGGA
jgi:hypothetical protein